MKLKKVSLQFRDLVDINHKLHSGKIEKRIIDIELAELIEKQLIKNVKSSYHITTTTGMINQQKATIHYTKNQGRINVTKEVTIVGDRYIKISIDENDGYNPTIQYFEVA